MGSEYSRAWIRGRGEEKESVLLENIIEDLKGRNFSLPKLNESVPFLQIPAKVRNRIWSYLEPATVLNLRKTCREFCIDVDDSYILPGVRLNSSDESSLQLLQKCSFRSLKALEFSSPMNDVWKPKHTDSLKKIEIIGPISQENWNWLLATFFHLSEIQINLEGFLFHKNQDRSFRLPTVKTLNISASKENLRTTLHALPSLALVRAAMENILKSLRCSYLENLTIKSSLLDTEVEDDVVTFAELFRPSFLFSCFPVLKNVDINLCWDSDSDPFITSALSAKDRSVFIEKNLLLKAYGEISYVGVPKFKMKDEPDIKWAQCEHLNLIMDFTPPQMAIEWRDCLIEQKNLLNLTYGLIQPILWKNMSMPVTYSSHSLTKVVLYDIAVWNGKYLVPLDLSIFEACANLKILHLYLSIFQKHLIQSSVFKCESHIKNALRLPQSIQNIHLARFTMRSDQIYAAVVRLQKLRTVSFDFLICSNVLMNSSDELGLSAHVLADIIRFGHFRKIILQDYMDSDLNLVIKRLTSLLDLYNLRERSIEILKHYEEACKSFQKVFRIEIMLNEPPE